MTLKGKCLCEKVEFTAQDQPGLIFNCHCSRCRKAHGSAFATQVFAQRETLEFTKGEDLITEYDGGTGGLRVFCSCCGSRLMNYSRDNMSYLSICISSLEQANEIKPVADCFTDDKLKWCSVDPEITKFEGYPNLQI